MNHHPQHNPPASVATETFQLFIADVDQEIRQKKSCGTAVVQYEINPSHSFTSFIFLEVIGRFYWIPPFFWLCHLLTGKNYPFLHIRRKSFLR